MNEELFSGDWNKKFEKLLIHTHVLNLPKVDSPVLGNSTLKANCDSIVTQLAGARI
jgi:hypothetical protein